MTALRDRLQWDDERGALHDGPRRYLMMRPDVLMGAAAALGASGRAALFEALAASVRRHGADSLRAYAAEVDGDEALLMQATTAAAADLGWGRWVLRRDGAALLLEVQDSPFVDGWRRAVAGQSERALCAPIRGMLAALADHLLGPGAQVDECECAAMGAAAGVPLDAASCRFRAWVQASAHGVGA